MDIAAAGGVQLEQTERLVLMPSSDNLVYWTRVYRLTAHNYAEEDALLVSNAATSVVGQPAPTESSISMESLPGTSLPKAAVASLDHLDPLVPLMGAINIDKNHVSKAPLDMMGNESEIIDLQTPTAVKPQPLDLQKSDTASTPLKKENPDAFVENPLMSNPWA